ncbi:MAG: sugar nucleotide-binding protein [bacterium]
MKIMVIGHTGMLGREVHKAITRRGHEVIGLRVNITEISNLEGDPEIVINCAGLVPQHIPSPSPATFMLVNGFGPWNLADRCDQIEARLIQVSTDCVFDGSVYMPDDKPHFEGEPPQPETPYGYSKLAGEIRREPHLTVRTSFVGFGKRGLIAELQKDEIYQASRNLLWTGHTSRFVAEILVMLAEREISGLLHIPGETFTRFDLVRMLNDALDLKCQYSSAYTPEIDRRLGSERWAKEGLPDLPSFKWQLEWLRRSQ